MTSSRRPAPSSAFPSWRDLLDALLPPSCAACGSRCQAALCPRCEETVEPVVSSASLVSCAMFSGAVADAVRRAKFERDVTSAHALGRLWVARIVAGTAAHPPTVDAVAFVPAPWRRRVARGFDLPALLAGALARHAQVPLMDALACTRTDAPLSFGADKVTRAAVVSGRYRARRSLAGMHVLLVDDVRTTGATLGEATRVLEGAGARVTPAPFALAP